MTDDQVIRKLAEREGWQRPAECNRVPPHSWMSPHDGCCYTELPAYLSSRDAVAPVLAKLTPGRWRKLTYKLADIASKRDIADADDVELVRFLLTLPAADLARAIAEVL